jgi:hypothetical protein
MMNDLFDATDPRDPPREVMANGAMLPRGSALPFEADILSSLQAIVDQAPFPPGRTTRPGIRVSPGGSSGPGLTPGSRAARPFRYGSAGALD